MDGPPLIFYRPLFWASVRQNSFQSMAWPRISSLLTSHLSDLSRQHVKSNCKYRALAPHKIWNNFRRQCLQYWGHEPFLNSDLWSKIFPVKRPRRKLNYTSWNNWLATVTETIFIFYSGRPIRPETRIADRKPRRGNTSPKTPKIKIDLDSNCKRSAEGIVCILSRGALSCTPPLWLTFPLLHKIKGVPEQWDWKCKEINEPYFRKKWEMRPWSLEECSSDECNIWVFAGCTKPWGRHIG